MSDVWLTYVLYSSAGGGEYGHRDISLDTGLSGAFCFFSVSEDPKCMLGGVGFGMDLIGVFVMEYRWDGFVG
jgi:hypothetical protein